MGATDLPRLSDVVKLPPGRILGMTKIAQALAVARGDWMGAERYAQSRWSGDPVLLQVMKSAATAGSLDGATWGSGLNALQTLVAEFISALRAQSIIGRLVGVRRVPFQIRVPRETAAATVGWVGERAPGAASQLSYDAATLGESKISGIVAIDTELARMSTPSAQQVIQDSLIASIAEFSDQRFISPAYSAVSNVSPASITSGLTAIAASGTTAAAIATDLAGAVDSILTAGGQLKSPAWIMTPKIAVHLALKRDAQGATAFEDINYAGGMLAGIPVITSTSVPASVSGGSIIALVDASELLIADDGQVTLDVSAEASIQMDTAPSSSASALTSLWQNNLIGIKATRTINWTTRHGASIAASYIDAVAY